MSYTVEVIRDGVWGELHVGRRYTLTAALSEFHRQIDKGRAVRVMKGKTQVECSQP